MGSRIVGWELIDEFALSHNHDQCEYVRISIFELFEDPKAGATVDAGDDAEFWAGIRVLSIGSTRVSYTYDESQDQVVLLDIR